MKWRRFAAVLLAVFLVFVVVHSLLSEHWVGTMTDPTTGQVLSSPAYECGPLWGVKHVVGPRATQFPLATPPCADRGTLQVLSGVDLLIAGGGLFAVFLWYRKARRDHPDADALDDAPQVATA